MGPTKPSRQQEKSTASTAGSLAPLADYFFIAGIESSRIHSFRTHHGNGAASARALGTTVEEDIPPNLEHGRPGSAEEGAPDQRQSKAYSWDRRKSAGSFSGLESVNSKGPESNRSSATIRAVTASGDRQDFEAALTRFTAERESVIDDLNFSSGQVAQPHRARPKAKTQRIRAEGDDKGSLRRRLSTMNPLSRSGTTSKRSSVRQSRRISGYNSVIPAPQRFSRSENVHPLKRPYEPALLDRYPTKEMTAEDPNRRMQPFPDYVPMFVFPNDINVVSSDNRPKTTWHGFAMTNGDGTKLHGVSLIVWIPLAENAAEELEFQCEEWRRSNMTSEEREMANSLGERLAAERSHLSELLAELREGDFASAEEYEAKQMQLSDTEEKIQVMADILKPVRHGAASKIEGLTDGESGLWIPRAYGILGRDAAMTGFWKEWLRAIAVPMTIGSVLRVPPSSPRVGFWLPLERYVVNICHEALSPTTSLTQVELAIRELRLYARKEAENEIPGSRNTDLWALFRSLQIPDIVVLFEYVLSESRIILLSSHTSMLYLVTRAITQLLWPLQWVGVLIPVLPARLIQALEAPCPYIVGIERRYENVELPEDDFVLVDLDNGIIEATAPPTNLPRQQRRKLNSILTLAAPHQMRFGVPQGPPQYAVDAYPNHMFSSENSAVHDSSAAPSNLAYLTNLNSAAFGDRARSTSGRAPTLNAFSQSRRTANASLDRPSTSSTTQTNASPPSPGSTHYSPSGTFSPGSMARDAPISNPLQAALRQQRSGQALDKPRRSSLVNNSRSRNSFSFSNAKSSKFGLDKTPVRRGSPGHASNVSLSTLSDGQGTNYAPSVYAQSTLAASTVMASTVPQQVHNSEMEKWCEGHRMQWRATDDRWTCAACDERAEDGIFRCAGCGLTTHAYCLSSICLPCASAFHPDQVIAAFVRCFASLFYTYRKYLLPASKDDRKAGRLYSFSYDSFEKSVPGEHGDYLHMLRDTQAFNVFIDERETRPSGDPSVRLFDEIILSKRNRGRSGIFAKSSVSFLADSSEHLWRTAAANAPATTRQCSVGHESTIGRSPAQLDVSLMKEPRVLQGVPRKIAVNGNMKRKPVPSMLSHDLRIDTDQP